MTKKTNPYIYAVGRRKSAVATVKLFKGKEESQVNKISVTKYFPTLTNKIGYERPFVLTKTKDQFYFNAKISGGGKTSQVQALALAISRCLKKIDEEAYKPILRTNGLLTVDSRIRQRRMVGTGGKARRQKQSPKR